MTAALAALALGVTGCTAGSDGDDGSGGKSGGGSQAGPAKPGTHASLPEPCGALPEDTLRELLVDREADAGARQPLPEGTASVTYDIDRRVGCKWKSTSALGSHHLAIDLERVVSYSSSVSDDDRAAELYDARARKDDIPDEAPEPQESEDGGDGESDSPEKDEDDGSAQPQGGEDGPTPSDTESAGPPDASTDPALAPRPLDGIGDAAYLNDELVTADSGLHRDITLVFRAGNVIVTVEYDQWSTDKRLVPGSEELQARAQKLAKQLVEQLGS